MSDKKEISNKPYSIKKTLKTSFYVGLIFAAASIPSKAYSAPVQTFTDDGRYRLIMDWDTGEFSIKNTDTTYNSLLSGNEWKFTTPTYGINLNVPEREWYNTSIQNSDGTSNLGSKNR